MDNTKIIAVEAIQSISDLKNNIKLLKAELDTLVVGSEEYNQKIIELAENQRALKLAQTGTYRSMQDIANASKLDTDAINETVKAAQNGVSTYNEMSAALGQLKAQIKTVPKYLSEQDKAIGQINPAYQRLNAQIQSLDASLKQLDADNGVFSRNVGNYVGSLEEWGGKMNQVRQVGNDFMGGIMGLLGVMALFGTDTDEAKESLQALVPVIAILNGAKGLGGLAGLLPKVSKAEKDVAQATKASTAAKKADTVATGELTVAEGAATTAGITLKAVLDSLGIGLIITAIVGLGAAVLKYVDNTNKAAQETKKFKEQQQALNDKFKVQNEELEREQKIKQAQGVSNEVLLAQKKQNIITQKNETEAMLANVKMRLEQMKADSAWVRFWKGENKQIKNLEEQVKDLTEAVKGYEKSIKDIDTDIEVGKIKGAMDAAKKATEDAKKEIAEYEKTLKEGITAADNEIKKSRTELTSLNLAFEDTEKVIKTGIDAVEKLIQKTNELIEKNRKQYENTNDMKKRNKLQEQYNELEKTYLDLLDKKDKLLKGQVALENNRTAVLNTYYSKEYEKEVLRLTALLNYEINKNTSALTEYETVMNSVFGYTQSEIRATIQATQETKNLLAVYEKMGDVIERNIRGITGFDEGIDLSNLVVSGLNWEQMIELSQTDAERLANNVGEPLATAIGLWFKNEQNIRSTMFKSAEEVVSVFNEGFEIAVNKNNYWAAEALFAKTKTELEARFKNDPIWPVVEKWIKDTSDKVNEMLIADPIGTAMKEALAGRGSLLDNIFGNKEQIQAYFQEKRVSLEAEIIDLENKLINAILSGDEENQGLFAKLLFGKETELQEIAWKEFTAVMNVYSQFLNDYGSVTADALSGLADAWDTYLKLRYKKQVESGKMSEKEAEKQAEEQFKIVKALQLGVTVINTAAAIMNALSTSGNWYVAIANAIAAAAEGAAQIMTIQMAEFGKPSVKTPGVTNQSTPSYTTEPEPIYYSVGINPMDYAEAQAQVPTKVYVTDQDIVEGIDKYNARKAEVTW